MTRNTNPTGEVGHTALSVADVLERAADRVEPEGNWTQGAFSRTASGCHNGDLVAPRKPACWCVLGAIAKEAGHNPVDPWVINPLARDAMNAFEITVGTAASDWNDVPERTQAEVVAKLREAAAIARTEARHD